MSKGIDISVAADTRSAMSAINRGLIDPLDDVAEALEHLGDESDDATRQLEKGFRDSQRETKEFAREIRDVGDELNKAGRGKSKIKELDDALEKAGKSGERAGKNIKDGMDDGMDAASEAGREFKDEFKSNFSEITSSFDGSMDSIQDLAQGTLGGLASTDLPGVGIAAGAAALAVGLIGSALGQNEEELEAARQRVADWAAAYVEAGDTILGAAQVAAEVTAITTDPERYKAATESAKYWGVEESTAIRAVAGDASALAAVQANLEAASNDSAAAAAYFAAVYGDDVTPNALALNSALGKGQDEFDKLSGEMSQGAARAKLVSDSLIGIVNDAESATKEVDEFGNELYTLPDGTEVLVSADTKLATENVTKFKGDVDGIAETVTTTAKVVVDDWNLRNYRPPTLWVESRVLAPRDGRQVY